MRKTTFKRVDSSVIEALWWNPTTRVLHVLFLSGGYYIYLDVNRYRYYRFRNAESKGKYFNKYIKKQYAYRKVR